MGIGISIGLHPSIMGAGGGAPATLFIATFDDGDFELLADFDDTAGADLIWDE